MHDSLTSKIFQRLGQEHTEVLGIAVNIHSLGTLERRQASPLFPPLHKNKKTPKTLMFPNTFYAPISL